MRLIHSFATAASLLVLLALRGESAPLSVSPSSPVPAAIVSPADHARLAAMESRLGISGNLRAFIGLPRTLAEDSTLAQFLAGRPIAVPGVHALGFATRDGDSLVAVSLASFTDGAETAGYRTGHWPKSVLATHNLNYAAPAGYIAVTLDNQLTLVSKRFRLRDFLTHDQQNVWPKVLVLRPELVDKLELIGDALERRGLSGRLHVMSGFRTPQYNALGVGAGGRANHSRHMYGDAADVFIDADGDGRMDDLDHDGRITVRDARVLFAIAEEVEALHPELIGGLSAYPANSAHGPFVHVDVRGVRARW